MFHLRRLLYFLTYLVSVLHSADIFSNFRRTVIINDSCDRSLKLETRPANLLRCSIWCGQDENCRRFLYSENSLLCTLYSDGNNCIVDGNSAGYSCFVKSLGCIADRCTCPRGYYGNKCSQIATDCLDYIERGFSTKQHVLTNIQPNNFHNPFEVSCWLSNGGGITILSRDDRCNMENFNRSLREYETGFGNVPWNRWLGFDKILSIIYNRPNSPVTIQVIMDNNYGAGLSFSIKYRSFSMGNSSSQYTFHAVRHEPFIDIYSGDSFMGSNGSLDLTDRPFSTYDSDLTEANCPGRLGGGWWFAKSSNCSDSFGTGRAMADNYWRNTLKDKYLSLFALSIGHY